MEYNFNNKTQNQIKCDSFLKNKFQKAVTSKNYSLLSKGTNDVICFFGDIEAILPVYLFGSCSRL